MPLTKLLLVRIEFMVMLSIGDVNGIRFVISLLLRNIRKNRFSLHAQCAQNLFLQIDRNYNKPISRFSSTDADRDLQRLICRWLYSFCDYIESKREEEDSMHKLMLFITFVTNLNPKRLHQMMVLPHSLAPKKHPIARAKDPMVNIKMLFNI